MGKREKGCGKEEEGVRGGGRREKGCGEEGEGVWGGGRRGVGRREKRCIVYCVLYSGKLSWREKDKIFIPYPQISQKTFANSDKTSKFMKVFSLESFPLYGI